MDARTGFALAGQHLLTLAAAVLLLGVWLGVGGSLRRRLTGADLALPADAGTRLVIDASLGAGVIATVMLALGVTGILTRPVVLGTAALLAPLAVRYLREWRFGMASFSARQKDWMRLAPVIAVALFLLLLLTAAVAPPTEWDSLAYHLRIPVQFLDAGRVMLPRDSFHVALVGAAQLATLPLLAGGLLSGPAVMHVLVLGLVAVAAYELARAAGLSRPWRWVAVAALLGCPVLMLTAVSARIDITLVLVLAAAHIALLRARLGAPRVALLGALLAGVALAVKPIAGAYAIALIPLGYRAAGAPRRALIYALAAALVAAPWYLKNYWLVGAPLYPVGSAPRFEPWLADLHGRVTYPDSLDTAILRALPESRDRFDVLDAFIAPARLTIETEGEYYRLSPVLALAVLVPLVARSHPVALRIALVAAAYAALIIIPFGRINLRYLMPALPGLAVGAVAVAELLSVGIRGRRARVAAVVIGAMAALPALLAARARFGDGTLLRHAAAAISANDVRAWNPDPVARAYAPVIRETRRLVPRDGRILLLWEARALPLERDALADIMLSNWPYVAQSPALDDCLASAGITHVLVNEGAVQHYLRRGADSAAFRLDALRRFRERCASHRVDLGSNFELLVLAPRR